MTAIIGVPGQSASVGDADVAERNEPNVESLECLPYRCIAERRYLTFPLRPIRRVQTVVVSRMAAELGYARRKLPEKRNQPLRLDCVAIRMPPGELPVEVAAEVYSAVELAQRDAELVGDVQEKRPQRG